VAKVYAVTGHRPQSLDGDDDYKSPVWQSIQDAFDRQLKVTPASYVITGGAIGVDQFIARRAYELGIPYSVIIPFQGYEDNYKWASKHRKRLKWLVDRADEVKTLYPGGYSAGKLHGRNHYMVDHCEYVFGVWNGVPEGGTYRCLEYARSVKRPWTIYTPPEHLYNMTRHEDAG
jgi:uncharacterized phage-like protein YoqJ